MSGVRPFSVRYRADEFADATSAELDVLVIGGGATGVGVALDAASRGLRVALVEQGDLASGTSSKSSKLIHGGLRYLENYELGLVHESVVERQLLQELAPHLVRPMEFVYPLFPDTARLRLVGLGMTTYDVLAGFRNVRRHQRVSAEEAVRRAPALEHSGLLRAFVYGDCATDDARLVLAVAQAARRFGALVLTYVEATRLVFTAEGRVCGAEVRDRLAGDQHELRARYVVNATGVWVDRLMRQEEPDRPVSVQPSKGVHLVVPAERLPLGNSSILLPSRQGDGRSMFAIPWGRQSILGTTDTVYDGPLDDVPVTAEDVEYILGAANGIFRADLDVDEVVGAWAGNRPLLRRTDRPAAAPSDMSRRHTLLEGSAGLLTITGGKLTTYRRMAKDVVDRIVARDRRRAACRTDEIALGGTRAYDDAVADAVTAAHAVGLDEETAELAVRQHGDSAAAVLALTTQPGLEVRLSPAAAHLAADVVHAARHEGAATLDDVLSRRTRLALRAKDAAMPTAPLAARLLAAELGRDDAWAREQVTSYAETVRRERGVLGLTHPPATSGSGPA
ncbi:MAG TPA: glycerol-3-phosphate dehydrogenase/oxidase [Mycobacteriales bacterium]|nr:glycerol-3-phosphate dehydrogenase/oxidase [Mycobacteriales bacterium]